MAKPCFSWPASDNPLVTWQDTHHPIPGKADASPRLELELLEGSDMSYLATEFLRPHQVTSI